MREPGTPSDGPTDDAPPAAPAPARHPGLRRGLAVGVRIALILAMLVAALLVFGLLVASREQSVVRAEPAPPTRVRAIPAVPRHVERVWEGFGTVRSMSRAEVAAQVAGRVVERPAGAEPGVAVARGDALLRIDPTDYEIALARAEHAIAATRAQLEGLLVEAERLGVQADLAEQEVDAAERDLERTERAMAQGAGAQGEVDARVTAVLRAMRELSALRQAADLVPARRAALEAQLAGQEAERRLAVENLARTAIVSPIDGVIHELTPRPGDYLASGTIVARVVDLSRVEAPLRLPASSASWLARVVGVEGAVSLWQGAAVGPASHVGTVTRVSPEADPASRTVTVFVEVRQDPERSDRLLPGSFVHGLVRAPDPVARVVLPRRALRAGRVMLAEPDPEGGRVARVHLVEAAYPIDAAIPGLDPGENEWVVLEAGSEPPEGAMVIVTGLDQLEPGARVRLADEDGAPEGAGP